MLSTNALAYLGFSSLLFHLLIKSITNWSTFQVLHSRTGSILDLTEKTCYGQTLELIVTYHKVRANPSEKPLCCSAMYLLRVFLTSELLNFLYTIINLWVLSFYKKIADVFEVKNCCFQWRQYYELKVIEFYAILVSNSFDITMCK
jgi:hypothetical protein